MKKKSEFVVELKNKISPVHRYKNGERIKRSRKENQCGSQRANPESHPFHGLHHNLSKNEVQSDWSGMPISVSEYESAVDLIKMKIVQHIRKAKAKGGNDKPIISASTLSQALLDLDLITNKEYNAVRSIHGAHCRFIAWIKAPSTSLPNERKTFLSLNGFKDDEEYERAYQRLKCYLDSLRETSLPIDDGRKIFVPKIIVDDVLYDSVRNLNMLSTIKEKRAYAEHVGNVVKHREWYYKRETHRK